MNEKNNKAFTLITGGSSGIGRAFAIECAKRGHNILLVAFPCPELKKTTNLIRNSYGAEVHYLAIDLTKPGAPRDTYNWCSENDYLVNILINNAGVAGSSEFESSTEEYNDQRIQLNIRALVLLSRLFLPGLKKFKQSFILNISSMSAFFAIPYKSVYSATKSFVFAFSCALRTELANTSVKVCVVCPAGIETNSGTHARIKAHGYMGAITRISSERLAFITLNRMFKGKAVIIPKRINVFICFLGKIVPVWLKQKILFHKFRKEFNNLLICM